MISNPLAHRIAILAFKKITSNESDGKKKSRNTLNHSDLAERNPSRVPNPATALTRSLILSLTGSKTRKILSICNDKSMENYTFQSNDTHPSLFHIHDKSSTLQGSNTEEVHIFRSTDLLRHCLRSMCGLSRWNKSFDMICEESLVIMI